MRGYSCFAHTHTSLVPEEGHHIHPLGMHGPDTPENEAIGCANAHSDTHYLLKRMLSTTNQVPWEERRTYGPGCRVMALRGYDLVMAYIASLIP